MCIRARVSMALLVITLTTAGSAASAPPDLSDGIEAFKESRFEDARTVFQRVIRRDGDDAGARAWLAETLRRMGREGDAADEAWEALDRDTCQAMAHQVIADIEQQKPGDRSAWKAWEHAQLAVACAPDDGNAWLSMWPIAIRMGDDAMRDLAIQRIGEIGFLGSGALAYNRWLLEAVPEDALLLVNGDLDTYPALVLQTAEGFRTDVAVVNVTMLNKSWYRKMVQRRHGLPMMSGEFTPEVNDAGEAVTPGQQVVSWWMRRERAGLLGRPIAISTTVQNLDFGPVAEDRLVLAGAFYRFERDPQETLVDVAAVRESLSRADAGAMAGPFVSTEDRSPVRATSVRLRDNIPSAALRAAAALVGADRIDEALDLVTWARQFNAAAPSDQPLERGFLGFELFLAGHYARQENYGAAEPIYREVIDRVEEGADQGWLISALDGLARVHTQQARYEEALEEYERSLDVRKTLFAPDHPGVADGLDNLGIIYQRMGRDDEAIAFHRDALDILGAYLGEDHPRVASAQNNLGFSLLLLGRYEEAETLLRKSLATQRKTGERDLSLAAVLDSMGEFLVRTGDPVGAEPLFVEALEIVKEQLPPGSHRVAYGKSSLAQCLIDLQRYPEAEALLLEAYPRMRELRGAEDADTVIARERLIALYENWGKPEKAEPFRTGGSH